MPRKIRAKESIPLLTEATGHRKKQPPSGFSIEDDDSLILTPSQEGQILTQLKLADSGERTKTMITIYPTLYSFRAGRIMEIRSAGRAEPRAALRAHRAVGRARNALDSLGSAGREAALPDDDHGALDALISRLAIVSESLETFVNTYPSKKKGPASSLALKTAVSSLKKIFARAHSGRSKSAGSFKKFCETTLRIAEPPQRRLGTTAIENAIRKHSRRS
jgi:hypothetical protein